MVNYEQWTEPELLEVVDVDLPQQEWRRYAELKNKRRTGTVSESEYQELVGITESLESANVRRIAALITLAELRQTTLDALMAELGIEPPPYE